MTVAPELDTRFRLAEPLAQELAQRFGTPLYVIDEAGFRKSIRRYVAAFRAAAPRSELSFASKANSTLAVLAIAAQEGLILDVASEGELRAALKAGADPKRCCLHGNNKSRSEIEFAFEASVGQIVADNFREIENLGEVYAMFAGREVPELLSVFDVETGAIAAEIVFAFKSEMARTLTDCLLRRTMVGLNSTCGLDAVEAAAGIACTHLGWSANRVRQEVKSYQGYVERFRAQF